MTLRVGLVGLGMMGTTHFKGYKDIPEARVAALCDVQTQRLEGDFSGSAGNIDTGAAQLEDVAGIKTYEKFDDLCADGDIDLIDICLPTFLHEPCTVQALQAGKHVFCEKPMALSLDKTKTMIAAAGEAGKLLMIGQCLRFWPEYVMAKAMIDSGTYGKPRSAVFRRLGTLPGWSWENWLLDPRRSGSVALDLHIHDVDAANWFFGTPRKLFATATDWTETGLGHVCAQYLYDDGLIVSADGAWDRHGQYPFSMSFQVNLETATIDYHSGADPSLRVYLADGTVETPPPPAQDAYTEELRYFVQCIASGAEPTRVPNASAAQAVGLVEKEVESVRSGAPVAVDL